MGPRLALPPAPPIARARRGPRIKDLDHASELARTFGQSAGETLRAVTAYGLDPFPHFAEFLQLHDEGAVACPAHQKSNTISYIGAYLLALGRWGRKVLVTLQPRQDRPGGAACCEESDTSRANR